MSGLQELMKRLGYNFRKPSLLERAITHSSYANERRTPIPSNERLEFLGDSVLGVVTAVYLFTNDKGAEGELTRLRAALVCEKALHSYSKKLELGSFIKLGRGEQRSGGSSRPSILADAFEAVVAAIFLDGGMESARDFLLPFLESELTNQKQIRFNDYKTTLQEIIQQNPEEHLEYVSTAESGPDHNKQFTVEVHLNSNVVGEGRGHSKKEAEQQAAHQALKLMGYDR
ncbi:MAG: ribonuclease III [Oscillospiraceae bacterium]|nr:ribonuclease III [Oscillospiraceae bacterium]MDD4413492.1 ribonuclease III [Oscillospiraceae bacterium]